MPQKLQSGRPKLPLVFTVIHTCPACDCRYKSTPGDRIIVVWPRMRTVCPECRARVETELVT